MCHCIQETNDSFLTMLKEKGIELSQAPSLDVLYQTVNWQLICNTYSEIRWVEKHTAKTGRVTAKKKSAKITHKFCPFCGEDKSTELKEKENV